MTSSTTRARHRAARRPITPLSLLASAASENVVSVGKRSAIVAASSGLLVSLMAAAPASAAPVSGDAAVATVDVAALATEARAALSTAPTVTVAADASWTVEQTEISVTPAPEPVKVRTVAAASRTAERTTRTATAPSAAAAQTATVAEAPAPASVAPASAAGSSIIDIASRYVGVPYVYGGSTPSGFDCSGFTSYVFAQAGISLPRSSGAQGSAGTVISRDQAQPGDLIWTPGHIAIYAGGNTQIDAPKPGKSVQFRDIWQSNPTFIRIG